VFGSGEYAARGHVRPFPYRSNVMSEVVNPSFAIFAKVRNGRCHYVQL
jgi:hypothetical protein